MLSDEWCDSLLGIMNYQIHDHKTNTIQKINESERKYLYYFSLEQISLPSEIINFIDESNMTGGKLKHLSIIVRENVLHKLETICPKKLTTIKLMCIKLYKKEHTNQSPTIGQLYEYIKIKYINENLGQTLATMFMRIYNDYKKEV